MQHVVGVVRRGVGALPRQWRDDVDHRAAYGAPVGDDHRIASVSSAVRSRPTPTSSATTEIAGASASTRMQIASSRPAAASATAPNTIVSLATVSNVVCERQPTRFPNKLPSEKK